MLKRNPFLFLSHRSQWRKQRIKVCSRLVSCCSRILIAHRVSPSSVVECHRSGWVRLPYIVRVYKDFRGLLFINRTVLVIVIWDALAFFTGCGNAFSFSVVLSERCGSSRSENNTEIKTYICHDTLLIDGATCHRRESTSWTYDHNLI